MARTSVDMENHTCDDRKCGLTKAATAGDAFAPPGWITGTAMQADADGRLPADHAGWVEWEACRLTHIRGAIEGALEHEGVAADEPEPPKAEPSEALGNGATRDVSAITARA